MSLISRIHDLAARVRGEVNALRQDVDQKASDTDVATAVGDHSSGWDTHAPHYPHTPNGFAPDISGADLHAIGRTGFFRGEHLLHAPNDNAGWWYITAHLHDAGWIKLIATSFGSGNSPGETYECVKHQGATWTDWARVYKGTDVYPVAKKLSSNPAINGTVFTGESNIRTAEAIHSSRNFVNGTLIETSIDYTVFAGDPFLLRITGNSYGRFIPVDISVQGYIYYNSLIHTGGVSVGSPIDGLVALLHNGHLCFWFPRHGYWEGYDISVITAYQGQNVNKVLAITDEVMPADATRVVGLSADIRQAAHRHDLFKPFLGAIDFNLAPTNSVAGALSSADAFHRPETDYGYGLLQTLEASDQTAQAQIFISHAGNDLAFRGGWTAGQNWTQWNRVLTDIKNPRAWHMDQYVRTTDPVVFGSVSTLGTLSGGRLNVVGPYSPASLSADSDAAANIRTIGHIQLSIGAEANGSTGHPVWLQAKHSSIDGQAFPLELNPLGGVVRVGAGGLTSYGYIRGSHHMDPSGASGMVADAAGLALYAASAAIATVSAGGMVAKNSFHVEGYRSLHTDGNGLYTTLSPADAGWAVEYGIHAPGTGATLAAFGAFGGNNTAAEYSYVAAQGQSYLNPTLKVKTNGLEVSGLVVATDGFMLNNLNGELSTSWITGGYAVAGYNGYGARIGFESHATQKYRADILFEYAMGPGSWTPAMRISQQGTAVHTPFVAHQISTFDSNVGIGTGNPLYRLVVSDEGNTGIEFAPGYAGNSILIQGYNRAASMYSNMDYWGAAHSFSCPGGERFKVTGAAGDIAYFSGNAYRLYVAADGGGVGLWSGAGETGRGIYFGEYNHILSLYNDGYKLGVSAAGIVGVGVTPSSWGTNYKAIHVGEYAAFAYNVSIAAAIVAANACNTDNVNWHYTYPDVGATRYEGALGTHRWYSAAAGVAGQPISFTQDMSLSGGNLSVAGAGTFGSSLRAHSVGTPSGRLVLRDDCIENHYDNYHSSVAFNYCGYGIGYDQYRDLLVYNGRAGLFSRFDGSGLGLVLGIGVETARAEGRRLRVIGHHDSATFQLYSYGGGTGLDPSLDFWASEPGQTYRGCGLGSNVNKHPYYGPRDSTSHGSYLRFREDGTISIGKSLPGETVFTDRALINAYGTLIAESAGMYMGPADLVFSDPNVRVWTMRAVGGAFRVLSNDGVGRFMVPEGLQCNGYLVAGVDAYSGWHRISKSADQGNHILTVDSGHDLSIAVIASAASASGQVDCVLDVAHNTVTGRSIRTTGTVNTSGADYAEYEYKSPMWSDWVYMKGDIVGFDSNGLLTPRYSEAVRFGVKSTNPSFVGGDDWASVFNVGPAPKMPMYIEPLLRSYGDDATVINRDADTTVLELEQYRDDVDAAKSAYASAMETYTQEKSRHDAKIEEARSWVERVAYSGKVPVNTYEAEVGDYLIPNVDTNGCITCYSVANPSLPEYISCIGRVSKILPDGRAEIVVISH